MWVPWCLQQLHSLLGAVHGYVGYTCSVDGGVGAVCGVGWGLVVVWGVGRPVKEGFVGGRRDVGTKAGTDMGPAFMRRLNVTVSTLETALGGFKDRQRWQFEALRREEADLVSDLATVESGVYMVGGLAHELLTGGTHGCP